MNKYIKFSILLKLFIAFFLISCNDNGRFIEIKEACNLKTPTENETIYIGTPNFSWDAVRGASSYQLFINGKLITNSEALSFQIPKENALEAGNYTWEVRSKNYYQYYPCGERAFTIIIPTDPRLVSPTEEACVNTTTPSFSWEDDGGIEIYRVEISKTKDFNTILLSDETIDTNYTCSTSLDNGRYYWRVISTDINGITHTSEVYTMTINTFIIAVDLPTPIAISPINSTLNEQPITFYWDSNEFNENFTYTFELSEDNFVSTVFNVGGLQKNSYTLNEQDYALKDASYQWRVKMIYYTCSGDYCTPININIDNCSALIDASGLNTSDICLGNNASLSFNATNNHSYDIYLDTDDISNTDGAGYVGTITAPNDSINSNIINTNGTYYWKIISKYQNCEGNVIVSSSFTTKTIFNATNLSVSGDICLGDTETLTIDVLNGYSYEVYYDTDNAQNIDAAISVGTINYPNNSINISSISNGGTYYFKVRSYDGMCYGDWIVSDKFRIDEEWIQATSSANFSIRDGFPCLTFNNKMWVLGGARIGSYGNDIWSSTDGSNWTLEISNAAWSGRHIHAATVFDNKMWIFAGEWQQDVWYSTNGVNWTCATSSAAFGTRDCHTAITYDNKMWIIGGRSNKNDVWYSTNGSNWICATSSAAFSGRYLHSSIVFDNKMWVIGGKTTSGSLNDVWYSTDGVNWTCATSNAAWSVRHTHNSIAYNNKMWVVLGFGNNTYDYIAPEAWYSTDGVNWSKKICSSSDPELARGYYGIALLDNKVWIIGGSIGSGHAYRNDTWYFTD